MAPPTIETGVIDFSSFGGGRFSLAAAGGGIIVEGLGLDRRVGGWPNGDVRLLQMGAHSHFVICDTKWRREK